MARYIDVHMEDADYLSDSIDSADCSLSPMTDPDAMPALSPMCKSEYDPQSPLHHALDFMPSLSPAHESDWTQMEPWDDPQAANEVDDEFDKEMTDINETKYDNHLTWDHKQQSSQNFLDKDIEMKFSEALTAPKLGDIFDQTESGENDDSLDHIIPVYNGGSLENKVVAFDFKEMNKIHQNIGSKKPLNTKVTKIASETKGIHSTDKTELDASSNDSEVDDLPSSCKMFDTCGCGKISCRRGDRCPSQHSIVADKHKDLVTYRKVAGVTPSAGTGAVDDGGKELQTHGHWTRWKEKLDQHMVVGNISLKDSDFVSVCKKGTIQQKDLENRLTILDNCDTSTEDLRKTQTVNKRNSLSGSINSGINASDLKRCKNVTVDLIDIHKTGKKCNKLETASSEMDSNSVNMSLDKGEVKERIKKVLGGREVTVRLEDVIKDECAFLRAVNLQDTASGQVEQNEKIYVPVKSCIEKGSGSLIDVEITKCSTQRAKNLKTSGKRKKVHVCSCGSKWSLTEFKRAICSCQIETILKAVGKPKRQYIKSGKYKRSYYSVSMRKLINWRPVEKPLSHKKGQKKKNKTLTGPVHVNVMGRFKDFIGNVSASENIQGTQSPSESAPETQSQSKSFRDIQTPSKSVAASQSTLESATDTQGLSESDPCAESDSQASQGHFMHTLGLLETSRLPQVALKAAPKVDSDDQPTTGKSTRVRKKTPKALALEQNKATEKYRQYVKGLLREQKRRTEQFKRQTGSMRIHDEPLAKAISNTAADTDKKEKRKLEDIYELNESEPEKQKRLRVKKLIQQRFNVKSYTLAQKLKSEKENVKKLSSQQPVPVLLIKATWNERANKENPTGASSLIETLKGQGTDTDAVGSNVVVPMDGIDCPDFDTVNGYTVQTSPNIEAADNSEPNVNGLHVKTEVLGDTDEPGPSDEIGVKISGEPWSLAPAVFSGSDEAEPFAVVENIEGDSEMPPDETELLTVINSNCDNVISNKNDAGIEPFTVVNIEGTQEVVCDSDDVPYTILRNDEYNELSTGENIFTESIEVKDELFPKAENYEELIDLPASSDQISNEPVALWNTLCAVNEEGQEIPMPMIGSTVSLPNMCSENSYFNDQDSNAWTVEIPLSNPSDACSAANYNTVSEGGQFTIVSGEFGQLGSKVVKIDENKCSDNQLIISSDSDDDIDVVTVDDPVNLAAIKFTTPGKTPGALDTPIGEKDKVENSSYIANRPNDSVSIKLSAISKTPAKRKRSTRTLDDIDNMSGNVINCARKPPYPLHDHCYCIQLGNTIQSKISPKRCIIESEHYKKTKMEENSRRDKSQIQSKTPLDGCSSTVPVMLPMVMILPTLNVPIMLSKSDMDYSGSVKQIVIEKSELDKKCLKIQTTNTLERKRRSETKALFQDLRDMIPEFKGNERTPKIAILKEACKLIHDLRKESSDKERHLHELALESRSLSLSLKDLTSIYMKKGLYGEKS